MSTALHQQLPLYKFFPLRGRERMARAQAWGRTYLAGTAEHCTAGRQLAGRLRFYVALGVLRNTYMGSSSTICV